MIKFIGPLIVVEDIGVSRRFYEDLLGQKVSYDFGVDVQFAGNLSIHQKAHFQELLGDRQGFQVIQKANNGELYFETDELEATQARLAAAQAELIHPIREQPWGQRCMRLYDPDGHILEIGESMEAAVFRLYEGGLSVEEIRQKTGMPEEFIRGVVG